MANEVSRILDEAPLPPPPPPSGHYVTSAYSAPARSSSSGSRSSGSSGRSVARPAPAPVQPQRTEMDLRQMAAQFGLSYDEIQAIPELKDLFNRAVAQNYSAERFTAELGNTNWWRNTSEGYRQWFDLKYSDPATWKAKWEQAVFRANNLAMAGGWGDLSGAGNTYGSMNWMLQQAAENIMAGGWTDDRVKSWFGGQVTFDSGGTPLNGDAGTLYNQIHQTAYLNGRDYTDGWYTDKLRGVLGGHSTVEQVQAQIRQEAASQYKAFSTQILAGQDAMTLAAPYLNAVSTLLEIPQGEVGLGDKLVNKAMTTATKDGGAYTVWQLENDTRNDERWRSTNNARESLMSVGRNVLTDFGKIF